MTEHEKALVVFQGKQIRRTWHNNEWYFSIIDVVNALEASTLPKRYWSDLKAKLANEGFEAYDKIVQLRLPAEDGKLRDTDCANTKSMFRIIQSIPSKKAEPFKQWLAQVGYERVQEIENPELAQKRMKELYKAKGYSDDWIEKRIRGIAVRDELTGEWKKRNVKTDREFAILTAEISKATFGLTPSKHQKLKGLKKENLRDHITIWSLYLPCLEKLPQQELPETKMLKALYKIKQLQKKAAKLQALREKSLKKEAGKK